jgi:hypothetical protein
VSVNCVRIGGKLLRGMPSASKAARAVVIGTAQISPIEPTSVATMTLAITSRLTASRTPSWPEPKTRRVVSEVPT